MDKIFDEYYFKIYYQALKKAKNKEDAEDLTNCIFVAIFEYFNANVDIRKIDNLIWKIAHNIWCTRAKKYNKEKTIFLMMKQMILGMKKIHQIKQYIKKQLIIQMILD